MVNLLPAILIGGPPNAGKSVLFYSLTKALHERGIAHHAIRACPDGEGNWFQEIHQERDQEELRVIRVKGSWTESFVQGICRDLERRHLPLLVDMGGKPRDWQTRILLHCTHSLLLLHANDQESADFWRQLVETKGLLPLAEIYSARSEPSTLTAEVPVIRGTLTGLERGFPAQGPLFDALVERIAALFSSYSLQELEQAKLDMAPAEFTIHLEPLLRKLDPQAERWRPEMLRQLVEELPGDVPLAIYGPGPGWLYATLAAHAAQQAFYQFDPRIGWLAPPTLKLSTASAPEEIIVRQHAYEDAQLLSIRIVPEHLDHLQADQLPFPAVSPTQGLILDGKLPLWLLTALVRLYNEAGVTWIACHQLQLKGAVVVMSRVESRRLGEVIPFVLPIEKEK